MKRAEVTAKVRKRDHGGPLPWAVTITYGGALHVCGVRPTHDDALAHALAEVGLTEKGQPPEGRDWANRGSVCSTCDDGGCPDCTDPTH